MKIASILLMVIAAGCVAFAYWGLETRSGRAAFDEMAGMIPFFVGVAGGAFFVIAIILAALQLWRRGC